MNHRKPPKQSEQISKQEQPPSSQFTRRDLLQGKVWKFFRSTTAAQATGKRRMPPLVMRYPKNRNDLAPDSTTENAVDNVPSIHGISIAPVAVATGKAAKKSSPQPTTGARPATVPVLRPPGAIEESQFLAGCTRCNDCATACPHNAIMPASKETLGIVSRFPALEGTPLIDPDVQACLMCEDFPCITACEPQVLTHEVPVMIGTARITEHLCVAHHGTTCTVCFERCPVEGAIQINNGKPTIDEAICTGCGVCRYVCPAPENAILLMPTFARPLPANYQSAASEK